MERIKKFFKVFYFLLLIPSLTLAESIITDPTSSSPMTSPNDVLTLIDRVQVIVNSVAGMLAFLVIAWGAFVLATAGGSPEKAANGKKILLYGLGGAIFIVLAYTIVKIIIIALGGQVF